MEHTVETTKNPLAEEKIGKLIARFAIPAIISMLVSSLYNIVDQIFIGQGVGMLGNAATNIAFPVSIICTATALLLGIGSASNYNLETGKGNVEEANKIAGTGLGLLFICGVIIAAIVLLFLNPLLYLFGVTPDVLPYAQDYTFITAFGIPFLVSTTGGTHLIRADRSPTYSMTCMLVGAIINTILDPLFIFTFNWGIKGAAWATVIGQFVSGLLVIIYFIKFRKMELRFSMLRPRVKYMKAIAALGMASCINQIAMAIVQITMNNTLRHYGEMSVYGTDIPLACVGIISKVNMVFMAICIGISQGCQPIWGFNYGAKKYGRVKKAIVFTSFIAILYTTGIWLIVDGFPAFFIRIFNQDAELIAAGIPAIRLYFFGFFMMSLQFSGQSIFVGLGKSKKAIFFSIFRKVIIVVPLTILLPGMFGMGTNGVFAAEPISNFVGGIACFGTMLLTIWRELTRLQKGKDS